MTYYFPRRIVCTYSTSRRQWTATFHHAGSRKKTDLILDAAPNIQATSLIGLLMDIAPAIGFSGVGNAPIEIDYERTSEHW